MTYFYYKTTSFPGEERVSKKTVSLWNHLSAKKNWRIVQLPNGYLQTEYKDIDNEEQWIDATRRATVVEAEKAIDESIEHYKKKLEFLNGPIVVKTFEEVDTE